MKEPKINDLQMVNEGTAKIRKRAAHSARTGRIKITINVDAESLEELKDMSGKSGVPYQKLLNQILKEGLTDRKRQESRLDRLEKEIERLKRKISA